MDHDETIRREFAQQAETFEDPTYLFTDRRLMAWIQEHVPPEAGERVLDVAGGTGHVARAYADTAAAAVVLDLTPEMLAVGQQQARAEGRPNVTYVRGDAAAMPFVDGAFDLVVSRFAVHHFERPEAQIGEMARVCRAGGRVAIIDLVASDPALADERDRLERMRDPSHTRALPVGELRMLLESAGARVTHDAFHDHRLPVDRWLAQASTAQDVAEAIRAELGTELAHRYAVIVAEKIRP